MVNKNEIVEDLVANLAELLMAFEIMLLVVLLLLIRKQYIISIFGMLFILVLGIEKRASLFERILSMTVIFVVTIGFMLF
jgi:hypothetical protein